jgi:hypothetical protein
MARRRRKRPLAGCAVLLVLAAAAAFAVIEGPTLLHRYGDGLFSSSRCTVTIDGASSTLTAEQADNAALIAATALRRELPAHAVTVALAAAMQESDLRNLDYGDRDSVGLFQQRPSQGWGTVEQIRDPRFAANSFYDHLKEVAGWQQLPVTEAAQAVQRSGHPLGYADHEADARLWARALTGEVPFGAVTCSLPSVKADPAAARSFADRVSGDFGSRVVVTIEPESDGATAVRVSSGEQSVLDAAATWSIVVASGRPVADVTLCDRRWVRAGEAWEVSTPATSGCTQAVVVRFPMG